MREESGYVCDMWLIDALIMYHYVFMHHLSGVGVGKVQSCIVIYFVDNESHLHYYVSTELKQICLFNI
jgi:hypothetical protein